MKLLVLKERGGKGSPSPAIWRDGLPLMQAIHGDRKALWDAFPWVDTEPPMGLPVTYWSQVYDGHLPIPKEYLYEMIKASCTPEQIEILEARITLEKLIR